MQGQEAASAQALQALRAWVRSICLYTSLQPPKTPRHRETRRRRRPISRRNIHGRCDKTMPAWMSHCGRAKPMDGTGKAQFVWDSRCLGHIDSCWEPLEALETELSRNFRHGPVAGTIKVADRLHSTVCPRSVTWPSNSRPGVLFASIRKYSRFRRHTSRGSRLYLDWT